MVVSAGASGAIFGIAGGLLGFLWLGKLEVPRTVVKDNLKSIAVFVAYNIYFGLRSSGIDNAAHLGGLAVGFVVGALLHRPLPVTTPTFGLRHYIVIPLVVVGLVFGANMARKQAMEDPTVAMLSEVDLFMEPGDFLLAGQKMFTSQVKTALQDNAVVIERLGQLQELELDSEASLSAPGEELVFNAFGSKGNGVINAVCLTVDADTEEVVSGRLRLESGETYDLFPETD